MDPTIVLDVDVNVKHDGGMVEERTWTPNRVFAPAATATRAEATAAITRMMNCFTGTEVR